MSTPVDTGQEVSEVSGIQLIVCHPGRTVLVKHVIGHLPFPGHQPPWLGLGLNQRVTVLAMVGVKRLGLVSGVKLGYYGQS